MQKEGAEGEGKRRGRRERVEGEPKRNGTETWTKGPRSNERFQHVLLESLVVDELFSMSVHGIDGRIEEMMI